MVKVPPDHPPGADAVSPPCVRLNARSMHTPLVWAGLCMTSDAAWDTKAHFGSGRAPACVPMSNSPPAQECGCRKLLFCPGTAQKAGGPAHSTFDFGCGFRVETDTAQKDGSLPHTSPPCAQPWLVSCSPRSARANDDTACGLSATIQQKPGKTTLPAFTLMDCGKFDRAQPVR